MSDETTETQLRHAWEQWQQALSSSNLLEKIDIALKQRAAECERRLGKDPLDRLRGPRFPVPDSAACITITSVHPQGVYCEFTDNGDFEEASIPWLVLQNDGPALMRWVDAMFANHEAAQKAERARRERHERAQLADLLKRYPDAVNTLTGDPSA